MSTTELAADPPAARYITRTHQEMR